MVHIMKRLGFWSWDAPNPLDEVFALSPQSYASPQRYPAHPSVCTPTCAPLAPHHLPDTSAAPREIL